MSKLNPFTVTAKTGNEDFPERSVEVKPSSHPDFNWECKIDGGLFRFPTKKNARENIKRIIENE